MQKVTPPTEEPGEQRRAIRRRSQPVGGETTALGEVTRQGGVLLCVVLRARDAKDMEIGNPEKQAERKEQEAPKKRLPSCNARRAHLN